MGHSHIVWWRRSDDIAGIMHAVCALLSHRGRNEMATILQMAFSKFIFVYENCRIMIQI